MGRIILLCILVIGYNSGGFAIEENLSNDVGTGVIAGNGRRGLSYVQAIVLGAVQGVTEFLPISSTGHLIITNQVLDLNSEEPVFNKKEGTPIIRVKKGEEVGYTMKDAADSYAIVIQGGTMLAILFLYHDRVLSILLGLIGRNPKGLKLGRNILLAFLPAACLGLIVGSWIESHLFSPRSVMIALVVGAVLMFVVEKWRKIKMEESEEGVVMESELDLDELTVGESLTIGGLQCLAMWPGTSRSMITIVGGYIAGLSPARAAEFSFLLGLVTLSAASFYKILVDGSNIVKVLNLGPVIFGCAIAFVTGGVAVKWLVSYLTKHGLSLFAWYRIVLALGIFLANYTI